MTIVSVIKSENVKYLHVPCYEGLTIEAIREMSKENDEVHRHFPDERDIRRLPRQWIINIVYSIVGEPFRQWV